MLWKINIDIWIDFEQARSQTRFQGGAEPQKVDLLDLTPLLKPHI